MFSFDVVSQCSDKNICFLVNPVITTAPYLQAISNTES